MSPHSAKPRFEVKDHGAPLITGVDELEEQIAAARNDREVADAAVQEAKGARAFLGVRLRLNSI